MRYVIGDIHGCHIELEELCSILIAKDPLAQIYALGDIMNKGPDSFACIQILQKYQVQSIQGNHDLAWLRWSNSDPSTLKPKQIKALQAYSSSQIKIIQSYIKSLPLYIDLGDFLLIHAGLQPGHSDLSTMDPRIVTTIRYWDGHGLDLNNPQDPHWYDCISWNKPVIFGHWALHGLMLSDNFICLDSGCVYGKELTAYCLETKDIIQVKAHQIYCPLD